MRNSAIAFACLIGLAGCDLTTQQQALINAGTSIACAELSRGSATLYAQCTDAAGVLVPIGTALAQDLIGKAKAAKR